MLGSEQFWIMFVLATSIIIFCLDIILSWCCLSSHGFHVHLIFFLMRSSEIKTLQNNYVSRFPWIGRRKKRALNTKFKIPTHSIKLQGKVESFPLTSSSSTYYLIFCSLQQDYMRNPQISIRENEVLKLKLGNYLLKFLVWYLHTNKHKNIWDWNFK